MTDKQHTEFLIWEAVFFLMAMLSEDPFEIYGGLLAFVALTLIRRWDASKAARSSAT